MHHSLSPGSCGILASAARLCCYAGSLQGLPEQPPLTAATVSTLVDVLWRPLLAGLSSVLSRCYDGSRHEALMLQVSLIDRWNACMQLVWFVMQVLCLAAQLCAQECPVKHADAASCVCLLLLAVDACSALHVLLQLSNTCTVVLSCFSTHLTEYAWQ